MFSFLAQHPEHRRQLVENPDVIPNAIEEMLRWETPVMMVSRVAVQDTELAGCPDPQRRSRHCRDRLGQHATRPSSPTPTWCASTARSTGTSPSAAASTAASGSHLARMELRVALREWHKRIPDYEIEPGHELVYTTGIRSIDHFPMRFTAKA